ncbi:serine/threonine-protein kinase [Luteolibacter arcticus]|uniref:Serine/threonine-protein kinase n=1 Tax=Luteolibacter arcticus TaxID=1581411 RepID=A0ABT3GFS7_9BACT|nr:serine/threonine-protein kinase [Luteolibacter arcticus]MCW1922456.1 serine/threonine-protein kinase [Luteolibacter arcticus]
MNSSPDPVIALFNEALGLAPEERVRYLDHACGGDAALRERVKSLLLAHDRAGDFMGEPVAILQQGTASEPAGEAAGDRIGPYKLLQQIGEGGCGVVFMAEQEEPIRRRVALKLVKPGMDTKSVITRFEAERQALAMMDHPNIAKVFDAGVTPTGRPYFVMELIHGIRITEFCDESALSTTERLELFVQVCHAVQHAHQKGIIHRDIKPSNILVTRTSAGDALPMVIDFGVAKAITGQRLTDNTLFTAFEMLIGTPAYMSPEQAAFTNVDVDTRTDIYGLGVLLYELLTGTTPFDARELLKVGLDEIRRVILDRDPVLPSTRLKCMEAGDLTATAQHRQSEPLRLIRVVRGDLDWIVMKAMEKDRARRYPTANALATDVQRYLADETITARPPGSLYKLRKWMVRNRLLAGSLLVIGLLLSAALAITSILLSREREARRQADLEKRRAQAAAATSQQVVTFLKETLAGVAPSAAKGRDTRMLREILDRANHRIAEGLAGQPEAEAELRYIFGVVYADLGAYKTSEQMFRRVLELLGRVSLPESVGAARAHSFLGLVLLRQSRWNESEAELQAALDLWKRLGLLEEIRAVETLANLSVLRRLEGRLEEAESLSRRVLELRRKILPPADSRILSASSNLGSVLVAAGKISEAEQLFRQLIEERKNREETEDHSIALIHHALGAVLQRQGKSGEARECYERAVAIRREMLVKGHPHLTSSLMALANLQRAAGKTGEAEALYREAFENSRNRTDEEDPTATAKALEDLIKLMLVQKKRIEVDALFSELMPPGFPITLENVPLWKIRAEFLARTGKWAEAMALGEKLVALQPGDHELYHTLAPLLIAEGEIEAYRELCDRILKRFVAPTDPFLADRMAKDCLIMPSAEGDVKAAAALAEVAVSKGAGRASSPLFHFCKALAEYRQGNFAEAIEWAEKVKGLLPHAAVEAGAILAMANHQLKQFDAARAHLAGSSAAFAKLPSLESGDLGGDWRDWIIARTLLAEARTLIEGSAR